MGDQTLINFITNRIIEFYWLHKWYLYRGNTAIFDIIIRFDLFILLIYREAILWISNHNIFVCWGFYDFFNWLEAILYFGIIVTEDAAYAFTVLLELWQFDELLRWLVGLYLIFVIFIVGDNIVWFSIVGFKTEYIF